SQISSESYGALGVVCADFNGDGWTDIYVANDGRPNLLWMNQGNGTFKNEAMLAGAALSRTGAPQSGMGVDAGDLRGRGREDLVVLNLAGEYANFYANNGKGWFDDISYESGLAAATRRYTGFGLGMFDYDNDGQLDLMAVNGAVTTIEELARKKDSYPLGQPKVLLHNLRDGKFEDVSQNAGEIFQILEVGRGAALGDIDNDGDIDVVVVNNSGPARLLINNVGHRRPWIGFRMVGEKVNRDMLGTRVAVFRRNALTLWRRVHSDGSY